MNKEPFISVVTVVYNGENTIRRTIESVLCQDFKDFEYIIVDGKSKDNTINIAREYESLFEGRLHIYSEPDKGIYDAMNKGIRIAKGDYIWLVNADDWIEPDALMNIWNFYKSEINTKSMIIAGWMNLVSSDNDIVKVGKVSLEGYKRASKKLTMGVCHPATIIPKCIYDEVGLYDDRYYISADMDFILRCFRNKVPVAFLNTVITNMMDGGISNAFPIKKNVHDIHLKVKKFCPNIFLRYSYFMLFIIKFFIIKIRGRYF